MNISISFGRIAVLVVALAGIAGVFFLVGKKNGESFPVSQESVRATPQKNPVQNDETVQKISENVLGSTYSEKRIGYEFQYPKEWHIEVNDNYLKSKDFKDNWVISEVQVGTIPNIGDLGGKKILSGSALHLEVAFQKKVTSIDSYINTWSSANNRSQVFVKTDMSVNGTPVYKYNPPCIDGSCYASDPAVVYEQDYIFVPKSEYVYQVKLVVSMNEKEFSDEQKKNNLIEKSIQEFESILKSFQIIP